MTLPTMIYGYQFGKEKEKRINLDIKILNKKLFKFCLFGIPAFNLYIISIYLRYF